MFSTQRNGGKNEHRYRIVLFGILYAVAKLECERQIVGVRYFVCVGLVVCRTVYFLFRDEKMNTRFFLFKFQWFWKLMNFLHRFGLHQWFDASGWLSREDQYCLECFEMKERP